MMTRVHQIMAVVRVRIWMRRRWNWDGTRECGGIVHCEEPRNRVAIPKEDIRRAHWRRLQTRLTAIPKKQMPPQRIGGMMAADVLNHYPE